MTHRLPPRHRRRRCPGHLPEVRATNRPIDRLSSACVFALAALPPATAVVIAALPNEEIHVTRNHGSAARRVLKCDRPAWLKMASSSSRPSHYRTTRGRIIEESFTSTHFRRDAPPSLQVFEVTAGHEGPFEHIWELNLPEAAKRWLVVAAERIDGGHAENSFHFSYSSDPDGPYAPAFSVTGGRLRSARRIAGRTSRQTLRQSRKR